MKIGSTVPELQGNKEANRQTERRCVLADVEMARLAVHYIEIEERNIESQGSKYRNWRSETYIP